MEGTCCSERVVITSPIRVSLNATSACLAVGAGPLRGSTEFTPSWAVAPSVLQRPRPTCASRWLHWMQRFAFRARKESARSSFEISTACREIRRVWIRISKPTSLYIGHFSRSHRCAGRRHALARGADIRGFNDNGQRSPRCSGGSHPTESETSRSQCQF